MAKKVSIEVNILELSELIDLNTEFANCIPKDTYDKKNKAGPTMGETAKKYRDRAAELKRIYECTWPK
jgi:hypothetical protein